MSSKTAILSRPTTVIRRILCGSSQERWRWAIFPEAQRREQKVARHEDTPALLGQLAELLHLRAAHGGRFFDEHVLARLEGAPSEVVVRRHRRRDHDRIDGIVLEHLVEARGHPRAGVALRKVGAAFAVEIAEPRKVREIVEVANEVLAPLAEAYLGHACGSSHHHSFHTFPLPVPFLPVAFRRSTTICARSTRSP